MPIFMSIWLSPVGVAMAIAAVVAVLIDPISMIAEPANLNLLSLKRISKTEGYVI